MTGRIRYHRCPMTRRRGFTLLVLFVPLAAAGQWWLCDYKGVQPYPALLMPAFEGHASLEPDRSLTQRSVSFRFEYRDGSEIVLHSWEIMHDIPDDFHSGIAQRNLRLNGGTKISEEAWAWLFERGRHFGGETPAAAQVEWDWARYRAGVDGPLVRRPWKPSRRDFPA